MIKDQLTDRLIIKPQNVDEKYFFNQQKIAREMGYGHIEISAEYRSRAIEILRRDQAQTLMSWVNYLSSGDALFPTWYKYYVFHSIIKMSQFDKTDQTFPKRSPKTTTRFPEIDREALAVVYESLQNELNNDKNDTSNFILQASFSTLYAKAITKIQENREKLLKERGSNTGEWIKYEQGNKDDLDKLVQSLDEKGTSWCTAGYETAKVQLEGGDFYVFYTEDLAGKKTIPRIAIRMEDYQVIEVRGVKPGQELEPEMLDIVKPKLLELPGGEKYFKKVEDMKRLTEIQAKHKQNPNSLDLHDLRFLYELDQIIEGFAEDYEKDPRVAALRSERDRKNDAILIYPDIPQEIAIVYPFEITNKTMYLLLMDENEVVETLTSNKCNPALLDSYALSDNYLIKIAVANNKNTPLNTLNSLLSDGNKKVVAAARKNLNLPISDLFNMIGHPNKPNKGVINLLLESPNTPLHILENIYSVVRDIPLSFFYLEPLALHPNTTPELREKAYPYIEDP